MTPNNNNDALIHAFQHAAKTLPFYKDFLNKNGISPELVTTVDAFMSNVPVITKEDVFPVYPIEAICQDGDTGDIVSAIVSSGTTGIFSYGLLTERDIVLQRQMLDSMMDTLFDAQHNPPIIINALPMGVSFVSSYPVIPTSVRTDIVLHVLKTFRATGKQFVIITDPHVLKKIVEEGTLTNFPWAEIQVSCIVGGTGFSDSYVGYIESMLNRGCLEAHNHVLGTFGVTEVGLNIFGSTPDLHAIRHSIEENADMRQQVFQTPHQTTPEIMYLMSPSVHVEICNTDDQGVGDIVLSHLDVALKTMLIRYKTGDRGKFLDATVLEEVTGIKPMLPLPVIAIFDRFSQNASISPAVVKEALYRNQELAQAVTGHFFLQDNGEGQTVFIQMKSGIESLPEVIIDGVDCVSMKYSNFPKDMEVNYENKWKHVA